MKLKSNILGWLFSEPGATTYCHFDDSELVLSLPSWFVRTFGPWIPRNLLLRLAPLIPHWDNSHKGIYIAAPYATLISSDRRHCLTYVRKYGILCIHRATTELQRWSWNGLEIPIGTKYRSPLFKEPS